MLSDWDRWLIKNEILAGRPIIRNKRVLYELDDFKITLYESLIERMYLLVLDGAGNQKGYMLQIPEDWTEYSFQLYGIWCKLFYDENNELQTETWFNFVDEEFETVEVDPTEETPTKSMPGRLPWQTDDNTEDLDDLLVKIDAALLENI